MYTHIYIFMLIFLRIYTYAHDLYINIHQFNSKKGFLFTNARGRYFICAIA